MIIIKDNKASQTRLEVPVPEFIPYACHYDASTILTKNGQLLQTIKIVGFTYETIGANLVDLRETIRDAILKNITNDNYALWLHTIRRKQSLEPDGKYDRMFMFTMHEAWCEKNYWRDKYVNELYITIIRDGESFDVSNIKDALSTFSFSAQRKRHNDALEQSYKKLNKVVDDCMETLSSFGAKRLTIDTDEQGPFSEPLRFFDKIIHLTERRTSVPLVDLSSYLATHKIAFGNNSFEIRDQDSRCFGAILSVKEYKDVPLYTMSKFMQLPQQFIITHSIEFINSRLALEDYKYQNYILDVSGDGEFKKFSGLYDMFKNDKSGPTDYCQQQITITIITDSFKKLDAEVRRSANELSKLGIVTVREDVNLESCFWAQLPANFAFINRRSPIYSKAMGGFVSLHNFPAGNLHNIWGSAVTLFRTAKGTPYFFNFHFGNVGHTFIVGPIAAGKTTLVNFLLSESYKFSPQIFILGNRSRSKSAVMAMEGDYSNFDFEQVKQKYNPLMLADNKENRKFLSDWFLLLIYGGGASSATEDEKRAINLAIDKLFSLEMSQRMLRNASEIFTEESLAEVNKKIIDRLAIWFNDGKYSKVFDNDVDEFGSDNPVNCIDISKASGANEQLLLPLVSYYMHKFTLSLNGKPAIMVVNDCWRIFNNKFMSEYLIEWLDYLTDNNAIAIITADIHDKDVEDSQLPEILINEFATEIYLPNVDAGVYEDPFKLTQAELDLVKTMKSINRNFLLIQGNDAIVAELNLGGLDFMLAILSGDAEAEKLIEQIIAEVGSKNPTEWLHIFCERFK